MIHSVGAWAKKDKRSKESIPVEKILALQNFNLWPAGASRNLMR
jgi:hypothetical protein